MAITKLDDINLYTGLTEDAHACWEMKKFLTDNGVKHQVLHYSDDAQHPQVFGPLSTWWEDTKFTKFPILIYTEVHDDLSVSQYPRRYFTDLEVLKASNFLELYNLGKK
jgi:hypothetical protein